MVTLRLMWGLLVLCVVAASPPRYARQAELEKYDNNNVDLDLNVDGDDVYDYYDAIDEPQIEIGTLGPDEDIDPSHGASLEEEEEEENVEHEEQEERRTVEGREHKELPIKPQLIPSGSGESGTLMGPSAQGEEELRLTPIDILQISGDISGSGDLGSGASGALLDEKASGSGEPLGSGGSGASGDISGSVDSGDLGSGVSGLSGSGIILISGGALLSSCYLSITYEEANFFLATPHCLSQEEELHLILETLPHEASGDLGESGISWVSGASGLPEVSGEPVASGVSEVSGEPLVSGVPDVSGESGVSEVSGEPGVFGVPEVSGESGVPEVSGVPGASGVPEMSGESGLSGVPEVFGESETSGVPEVYGESGISGVPEESGESGISAVPEVFKKPETFEGFEESGVPEETGEPVDSLESGESGVTEAPDITTDLLIPDLDEEEEILLTTPTTPLEGTGGDIGSGLPDNDTDIDTDTTGMATCMLCTCLVGSVYCDDLKLERVPPLSKETTHFYARYNKIARISKSDFANLNKLKRIDLTSNGISRIDDDAFFGLPALEELILRENSIRQLPALPPSMTHIDACHNQLGNTGIQREAFKDMPGLLYLYLTDNNIDHIPVPLPDSLRSLHLQNNNIQMMHEDTFCNPHDLNYIRNALEDVRLDGNPINLSRTPQAYICLPRIPIGALI
ncbi:Epiphycan [Anabarilius grahami]|uniref:Epiphycan n=1 Tax=Anabarilius grahami TaxID=495550 RepID=A0A3N0XDR2_ANAGA|nr:Epiphycan [Anabarilius grahami]